MAGSGRRFRRIDSWTCRGTAHEEIEEPWTGSTWFALKCCEASEPTQAPQRPLRAPARYGERPKSGSERRSVLEVGCRAEPAASDAIQLGPPTTRVTGPVMQERLGALSVRHLPRERAHVKRHAYVVVAGGVSEKRAHVKRHPLRDDINSVFAENHAAHVCRPYRPEACEELRAPRFVGGVGPWANTIHTQ